MLKDIGNAINLGKNLTSSTDTIKEFGEAWDKLSDVQKKHVAKALKKDVEDIEDILKQNVASSSTNQETAATRENTAATQQGTAANEAYAASEGSVASATNASTAAINAETAALQRNTEARAAANAQDAASDILDITPNVSTSPTVTAPSVSQIGNVSQELAEGTTQINQQTSPVFLRILCEKQLKFHADSYIMKITKGKHTDRRCAPKSLFATK
ncbi:MAG: hypothetical protein ACI4PM_01945 [Butyricicoccus sp.]